MQNQIENKLYFRTYAKIIKLEELLLQIMKIITLVQFYKKKIIYEFEQDIFKTNIKAIDLVKTTKTIL